MNKTNTVQAVADQSQVDFNICQEVIKSYERYCERNITRCSQKHIDKIIEFTAVETGVEQGICKQVMTTFFTVVGTEIKRKIPFVK